MSVEPGVSVAPTPGQLIEEVEDIPTNDVEGQDDGDNFDEFEPTVCTTLYYMYSY